MVVASCSMEKCDSRAPPPVSCFVHKHSRPRARPDKTRISSTGRPSRQLPGRPFKRMSGLPSTDSRQDVHVDGCQDVHADGSQDDHLDGHLDARLYGCLDTRVSSSSSHNIARSNMQSKPRKPLAPFVNANAWPGGSVIAKPILESGVCAKNA